MTDCPHHWKLASPVEGCHTVSGRCRLCGAEKEFTHFNPANEKLWRRHPGNLHTAKELPRKEEVSA